ncbi:MAG: thioredoxin domain-containing protein [Candidatus Kapabacteria bacterium]|nr:thioredoxin domain-containing protein [Candidatus Kapabacteria bacterium]
MENTNQYTNELINESSPYLLQHAHNPVNWLPWGDKALNLAKQTNKPIIISIGYAACHWCHVMENESFEDAAVAKFMNANYICIKVDREERPDVDQIYMNAIHQLGASGGWPLNALALPDGTPFYAVTYMAKKNWLRLLQYFHDLYRFEKQRLLSQAEHISSGFSQNEYVGFGNEIKSFDNLAVYDISKKFETLVDNLYGGMSGSPKFPMPNIYQYLLRDYFFNKNASTLEAVDLTLQRMLEGGIYDQIGGGFSRYSTDNKWIVPHFEKMLYDNAQLVSLYSEAYEQTKNENYKRIVYETSNFIQTELSNSDGAFYSSLDADSEGKEGSYYTWRFDDLKKIIDEENFPLFSKIFSISKYGNWEGKNILTLNHNLAGIERDFDISKDDLWMKISEYKDILLAERNKREKPRLDNKIICSWNALMLQAYIDAYRAFGDSEFLKIAIKNAKFIRTKFIQKDHSILRTSESKVQGFLDDYAFTIEAFISLYEITFEENYLNEALNLCKYVIAHFQSSDSSLFYYTSDNDKQLIARLTEVADNVIPSSNSVLGKSLFKLGEYFAKHEYKVMAEKMLSRVYQNMKSNPAYFSNWAILNLMFTYPLYQFGIIGKNSAIIRDEITKTFTPNVIFFGGSKNHSKLPLMDSKPIDSEINIYVCSNGTCQLPVQTAKEALRLIGLNGR